ncbi:transmembrane protein 9 [Striga asiatica]|uniref:Transmembrane protein 9 n=1 Tax=Striga asiatica TaxID=4170 RepID=A0A5A7QLY1_STRAF|nr:transmembrane protein 9 [Striga asiatica]
MVISCKRFSFRHLHNFHTTTPKVQVSPPILDGCTRFENNHCSKFEEKNSLWVVPGNTRLQISAARTIKCLIIILFSAYMLRLMLLLTLDKLISNQHLPRQHDQYTSSLHEDKQHAAAREKLSTQGTKASCNGITALSLQPSSMQPRGRLRLAAANEEKKDLDP